MYHIRHEDKFVYLHDLQKQLMTEWLVCSETNLLRLVGVHCMILLFHLPLVFAVIMGKKDWSIGFLLFSHNRILRRTMFT